MKSWFRKILTRLKVQLIAAALFSAGLLSGCSTLPGPAPLLLPPPGAMEKAQPLPTLKQDATVADLIDSDVQVAGQYRELAARHGKLVDWVDSLIKKQASE